MCDCYFEDDKEEELITKRDLADMRSAIADLKKSNAELKNKLYEYQQVSTSGPCYLKLLPLEIRTKLFNLLLVSPRLSDCRWLDKSTKYGRNVKFGLSPNILGTCSWIHEDATPILYGSNTFVLLTHERVLPDFPPSYLPISPLTRYFDRRKYERAIFRFEDIFMFSSIRRWRICEEGASDYTAAQILTQFCKLLTPGSVTSLEVIIIYRYSQEDPKLQQTADEIPRRLTYSIIQTLSILRRVETLIIRCAQSKDLPASLRRPAQNRFLSQLPYPSDQLSNLRTIIGGSSGVERVCDMYRLLLSYAQAFEHCNLAASDIDPDPYRKPGPTLLGFRNPFGLIDNYGAIKRMLLHAYLAGTRQDAINFRIYRQKILAALDCQYLRIVDGYQIVKDLVDENRNIIYQEEDRIECVEALDPAISEKAFNLIKEQTCAFERDVPPQISHLMRKQPIYRLVRDENRHRTLEYMKALLQSYWQDVDNGERLAVEFRILFKRMVDSLIEQCQKVVKARNALLDADLPELACAIDLGRHLNFEPIDWDSYIVDDSIHIDG